MSDSTSTEDTISIEGDGIIISPTDYEVDLMVEFMEGRKLETMPEGYEDYLRHEVRAMIRVIDLTLKNIEQVAAALEAVGNNELTEPGSTQFDIAYTTGQAHGKLHAASVVGLLLNQTQALAMTMGEGDETE